MFINNLDYLLLVLIEENMGLRAFLLLDDQLQLVFVFLISPQLGDGMLRNILLSNQASAIFKRKVLLFLFVNNANLTERFIGFNNYVTLPLLNDVFVIYEPVSRQNKLRCLFFITFKCLILNVHGLVTVIFSCLLNFSQSNLKVAQSPQMLLLLTTSNIEECELQIICRDLIRLISTDIMRLRIHFFINQDHIIKCLLL